MVAQQVLVLLAKVRFHLGQQVKQLYGVIGSIPDFGSEGDGSNPSGVYLEFVAQLVEHQVVALVVVGSRPIKLPNRFNSIAVVQFTRNEQVVGWLRLLPSRLGKAQASLALLSLLRQFESYLKLYTKGSLSSNSLEKKPFSFLVRRCLVDVHS